MIAQLTGYNALFISVTVCLIVTCMILAPTASAQVRSSESVRSSPNAVVGQTIGTTDVTITYGRPSVRDRVIFGELVPFDTVWRTGANEATTITFSGDVTIEGEPIPAGTYGLFTIPRENSEWTLIFNNTAEQWGAYRYDAAEDVLRVNITATEAPHAEQMLFLFEDVDGNSGTAVLYWKDVRVAFRIDEQ